MYSGSYYGEDEEEKEFFVVNMIENHRIQDAASAQKYVKLNSKTGAIEAEIFSDLQGSVSVLAKDRFLYRTYSGDVYLLDNKGNSLGKVNKLRSADFYGSMTDAFFVYGDRVYDYNLQEVYSYAGQKVHSVMNNSIIFSDSTGYHLLTADGTCHPLDSKDLHVSTYGRFFIIANSEANTSAFFDEAGVKIGEINESNVRFRYSNEDMVIVSVGSNGADDKYVEEYYKLYTVPVTE